MSTARTALFVAVFCALVLPVAAQEADGVVLVRVEAKVTAVFTDDTGESRKAEELPVSVVATGSGLVVSRLGYVITNNHVVSDAEYRGRIRGSPARITLSVQRVEVYFPPDSRSAVAGTTLEASVMATDPELDLAVLTIPGNDLPYVPLGDSDALRVGQPASAVGYPLGEALDVGSEPGADTLVPAMAPGAISALRPESDGTLRYIQTSAPLNRGNSGGPLLDRYGFAIGVVQAKARAAEGIGFAIPINLVKDFLSRNGLDTSLPATRLTLGHLYDSSEKLLRFQAPSGFEDAAETRLAIDSGSSLANVVLHIDRIASTWTLEQIEGELSSGQTFEPHESLRVESPIRDGGVLRGEASIRANGRTLRMLYSLIDLRGEKLVARYIGAAEQIAFNESVLAASLASIESAPMLAAARGQGEVEMMTAAPRVLADLVTKIPADWVFDAGAPIPCGRTSAMGESLVVSPRNDFATSFRIARYPALIDGSREAKRCAGETGSVAEEGYKKHFSKYGIEYTVEGRIVSSGSRSVQVEVAAPTRTFAPARAAFARWTAELGLVIQ